MAPLDPKLLDTLRKYDTPTICNGLEIVVPHRRATGFTTLPMVSCNPALPPIIGYARTVTIRAVDPSALPAMFRLLARTGYVTEEQRERFLAENPTTILNRAGEACGTLELVF